MSTTHHLDDSADVTVPVARRIGIIGSGPVGMRLAHELLKRNPRVSVHLFGNEPYRPYNRVQLSAVLAGEVEREDIYLDLPDSERHPNFKFTISVITCIDPVRKTLTGADGKLHTFDALVFATGARAHVPSIKGVNQKGVYTFRNLKDTDSLFARLTSAREVVVVGGGLLGIEAAKGLSRFNTRVTLVQQGPRLMNRQLDEEAAALLKKEVEDSGIRVIVNAGVREIRGESRVSSILTNDGEEVACDTVLLCAGITPNVELARDAGLTVRGGIVVDDQLLTSAPGVYAVGECCEHQGKTYGVVNPGYEQAAVAAAVISGEQAHYISTLVVNRLKVIGEAICSIGEVVDLQDRPFQREYVYRNPEQGIYRRLIFYRQRLLGIIAIGDWPELSRVQEAFTAQRRVGLLQIRRFLRGGCLWSEKSETRISEWPAAAVICQCNNVTQGELQACLSRQLVNADESADACAHQQVSNISDVAPARGLEQLRAETGAGTVCGSCKPLLVSLVSEHSATPVQPISERGWSILLMASVAALFLVGIVTGLPEAQTAESVQRQGWFESVWNDKLWKQITGFTLLGMTAAGLLMSLRKRFNFAWMGDFGTWRLGHAVLGLVCAVALVLHTGLHLGVNLNFLLMLNFLLVLTVGAMTGMAVALSHRLSPVRARQLRLAFNRFHIVVSWPLPALLLSHIVSVYYF
ncbi:MAG TPA: hypothetical protein DCF62_13915 [Porticoccaceae bacterium]|nr:hypothetical protein [Porticoccaceae bacterium]HCO61103.1 hypothetical protein [Porticoccaceae bacterium]